MHLASSSQQQHSVVSTCCDGLAFHGHRKVDSNVLRTTISARGLPNHVHVMLVAVLRALRQLRVTLSHMTTVVVKLVTELCENMSANIGGTFNYVLNSGTIDLRIVLFPEGRTVDDDDG